MRKSVEEHRLETVCLRGLQADFGLCQIVALTSLYHADTQLYSNIMENFFGPAFVVGKGMAFSLSHTRVRLERK